MSLSVKLKKRLGDFSLEVDFETEGGILGCLGASGCGKSLMLRCIAGVERPDEGRIVLNGRTLFESGKVNLPPQKRNVGLLFQNYSLFPHMTVEQNIRCACKRKGAEAQQRTASLVKQLQLAGLEQRRPEQLSGGQQQRTALARLLAAEPELILLDEPFSALDSYLRVQLQSEMKAHLKAYGKDVILVSHSRDEVYRMCGSLMLMDRGRLLAGGETRQLFASPGSVQGARLTGCKNIVAAQRTGAFTAYVPEWDMSLHTKEPLREALCAVGLRAHSFSPDEKQNAAEVELIEQMEEPFEWTVRFRYKSAAQGAADCWWRIAKESKAEKMPRRLGIAPEHIMPLYPVKESAWGCSIKSENSLSL